MATAPEAVPLPNTEEQKSRKWKRVRGGEHQFSKESSMPTFYGDLIDDDGEQRNPGVKRTFRDTVVGKNTTESTSNDGELPGNDPDLEFTKEMFDGRIVVEEKLIGKHECPVFTLSKWEETRIQKPWKQGLIVRLLGRKIGFKALETRLNQLWVSKGTITIIDLGKDCYLVTFTNAQDRDFALAQGPWLIFDHYLIVREWSPNFDPDEANVDHVAVWVRFSGLPIEYYDPAFLHFVGNRIGRTVKVDKTTLQHNRGKYARLCVEVDLNKPLLAIFEVKGKQYRIEYEGLHLLCLKCGRFGHYKEGCTMVDTVSGKGNAGETQEKGTEESDSLWTVVQKNRGNPKRKNFTNKYDYGGTGRNKNGSRFAALNEEVDLIATGTNNLEMDGVSATETEVPNGRQPKQGGIPNVVKNYVQQNGAQKPPKETHREVPGETPSATKADKPSKKTQEVDMITLAQSTAMDTEQQGVRKDSNQVSKGHITSTLRYEDWVEIDTNGESQVQSYEVRKEMGTDCSDGDPGDSSHHMVEDIQGHTPRPPEYEKHASQQVLNKEQNATQQFGMPSTDFEFEFGARGDSIMEHVDEPSAKTED